MERLARIKGHLGVSPVAGQVKPERAVLVDGARTPFCRSFTEIMDCNAIALGCAAVDGLIKKTKLDPQAIDEIIMGNVVVQSNAPNIAREIIIDLKLPAKIPGTTVSVACLSGLQAIAQAVMQIEHGDSDVIIAGGSDSLSSGELSMPKEFTQALAKYTMGGGQKKGWAGTKEMLWGIGLPNRWIPTPNSVAERSTGKTMGYHADLMAEINKIKREDQDKLALASHVNAHHARENGKFEDVVPVTTPNGKTVTRDNLIRAKMNPDKVAKLKACFRPTGTITAATSSALTDGASAVLVMSETKARALGYPADIVMRAYVKTAIEPMPQLLMAPAIAIPKALDKAGLTLDQIDIIEVHEAFAGQVLATLAALQSAEFARDVLKRDTPVGKIDPTKINLYGGSIAIGHPFAATGGRIVTCAMRQLREMKKKYCLISICAAGGIGGVAILENIGVSN